MLVPPPTARPGDGVGWHDEIDLRAHYHAQARWSFGAMGALVEREGFHRAFAVAATGLFGVYVATLFARLG